jgi:ribosome-binding protein aMBF1 (putative translation factor)
MNLAVERINRGLSIRQLAELLKINAQVIARAEKGEAVHPANAKKIADYYGCKVTDIWPVSTKAAA